MPERSKEEKQSGCFAWMIRVKKAINERWARARNAFRTRFHKDNGTPISQKDLLNETGRPDIVISKVPVKAPTKAPTPSTPVEPEVAGPEDQQLKPAYRAFPPNDKHQSPSGSEAIATSATPRHVISCTADGDPDEDEVRLFVEGIIEIAKDEILANTKEASIKAVDAMANQEILDDTKEAPSKVVDAKDDAMSISSSVLSEIAEIAVAESLSRILTDTDTNQSAALAGMTTPRTISEVLERFGIDPKIGIIAPEPFDLPPCDP